MRHFGLERPTLETLARWLYERLKPELPPLRRVVLRREEDADAITRDMMLAVRRTFITPFDRGDIQALISAMDDSIDQMKKTAKAIVLFRVREFEPDMRMMGDAIVECAGLLHEAVPCLRAITSHAS